MKKIDLRKTGFCTKCKSIQNITGSLTQREEDTPDQGKKSVTTVSYHCEKCNSFLNSEEFDDEE